MNCSVTDVEADVVDKLKYIEETKETMDENVGKLAELAQDISGIHKGKKIKNRVFLIECYEHH